ncbi:MAG TPA: prepilin-type N-terminal cleavage/methylation domain-containing protein [Patescibacteria group bacterium]|nr:prepilin-type N-terminal cleavage/methylation domain-containing protein [Patescibacteria group bacterium]
MRERKIYNRRGQSLLELVVAVGIISIALVALLSLSVVTVSGLTSSREAFLAYNYAREGIELIQDYRDSAFLARTAFNLALPVGTYRVDAFDFDGGSTSPFAVSPTCISSYTDECRLYISSQSRVMHARADRVLFPTPFYRVVEIKNMCLAPGGAIGDIAEVAGACTTPAVPIAKKAIVKIAWKSNGVNRAVVLVKEFYDWKSL